MYITLDRICKKIKGITVIDNISFRFDGGKVYGLQGKNGCGKTMLMRLICGLIIPTSGTIDINGEILHKDISFPRSIGALIESPSFLDAYTGFSNLKLLSNINRKITNQQIVSALTNVGLNAEDKRVYRKYSLGMKQKLGIACAIMDMPDILILDEPLNALDKLGAENVRQILYEFKANDSIVVIACHDKDELESLTDFVISMESGRIL